MSSDSRRGARLEVRITPDVLAVVRRAAELTGCSVSDFLADAAYEVAQRTIRRARIIKLSMKAQRRFIDVLLNSSPPNAALKRARKAHSKLIIE